MADPSVSIQLPGLAETLLWQAPRHGRLQHLVFLYPEGLSGVLLFLLCLRAWSPKLFTRSSSLLKLRVSGRGEFALTSSALFLQL